MEPVLDLCTEDVGGPITDLIHWKNVNVFVKSELLNTMFDPMIPPIGK